MQTRFLTGIVALIAALGVLSTTAFAQQNERQALADPCRDFLSNFARTVVVEKIESNCKVCASGIATTLATYDPNEKHAMLVSWVATNLNFLADIGKFQSMISSRPGLEMHTELSSNDQLKDGHKSMLINVVVSGPVKGLSGLFKDFKPTTLTLAHYQILEKAMPQIKSSFLSFLGGPSAQSVKEAMMQARGDLQAFYSTTVINTKPGKFIGAIANRSHQQLLKNAGVLTGMNEYPLQEIAEKWQKHADAVSQGNEIVGVVFPDGDKIVLVSMDDLVTVQMHQQAMQDAWAKVHAFLDAPIVDEEIKIEEAVVEEIAVTPVESVRVLEPVPPSTPPASQKPAASSPVISEVTVAEPSPQTQRSEKVDPEVELIEDLSSLVTIFETKDGNTQFPKDTILRLSVTTVNTNLLKRAVKKVDLDSVILWASEATEQVHQTKDASAEKALSELLGRLTELHNEELAKVTAEIDALHETRKKEASETFQKAHQEAKKQLAAIQLPGILERKLEALRNMLNHDLYQDPERLNQVRRDRRFGSIVRIGEIYAEIRDAVLAYETNLNIAELDHSLAESVMLENEKVLAAIEKKTEQLKDFIAKLDRNYGKPVILEIRANSAATSTTEGLVGKELLSMYLTMAKKMGWDVEIVQKTDSVRNGGVSDATLIIEGDNAYRFLRYEGGDHKFQLSDPMRSSKLHTGHGTVAILVEETNIDFHIDEKDLEIKTTRSGGPGGQNVNKTETAVQITHKPSGLQVRAETERSQLQNKKKALSILAQKLKQLRDNEKIASTDSQRKAQLGYSAAGAIGRVRTYSRYEDIVSDNRLPSDEKEKGKTVEIIERGGLAGLIRKVEDAQLLNTYGDLLNLDIKDSP